MINQEHSREFVSLQDLNKFEKQNKIKIFEIDFINKKWVIKFNFVQKQILKK